MCLNAQRTSVSRFYSGCYRLISSLTTVFVLASVITYFSDHYTITTGVKSVTKIISAYQTMSTPLLVFLTLQITLNLVAPYQRPYISSSPFLSLIHYIVSLFTTNLHHFLSCCDTEQCSSELSLTSNFLMQKFTSTLSLSQYTTDQLCNTSIIHLSPFTVTYVPSKCNVS